MTGSRVGFWRRAMAHPWFQCVDYTASSIILLYLLRYNHVTIKGHILEIAFRFFGVFFLNLLVKQAKLNFCKMDWSQFHFLLLGTSTEKRASTDDKQPARERGGAVGPAPAQNRWEKEHSVCGRWVTWNTVHTDLELLLLFFKIEVELIYSVVLVVGIQ